MQMPLPSDSTTTVAEVDPQYFRLSGNVMYCYDVDFAIEFDSLPLPHNAVASPLESLPSQPQVASIPIPMVHGRQGPEQVLAWQQSFVILQSPSEAIRVRLQAWPAAGFP